MKYTIFDIECDGLLEQVTKIYCLAYQILDENLKEVSKGNLIKYDEILGFILSQEILVGHNIVLYDIPVLEKILNFKLPNHIKTIDTLGLSWYLYDGRTKHGLDEWGKELGIQKPKISSWTDLKLEDYIFRCTEDVRINTKLFIKELEFLNLLYNNRPKRVINYISFKLDCLKEQQEVKIKIDTKLLKSDEEEINNLISEKRNRLINSMPKQPVYKIIKKSKNLYKKDGSLSNLGEKWFSALKRNNLSLNYEEEIKEVVDYEDGNPNSPEQIKDWLYLLGWKPLSYKESKSLSGEIKQVPQIYNEKKEVCDSVKILYTIEPELENLDMLGVLKHRQGIIKSFIETIDENGYVIAGARGFTSTFRLQHSRPCVNLPKVSVYYGEKIRGLFTVPNENYTMCGSDMAALEATTQQALMYDFDPDYVNELRTPGFDPHLDIAVLSELMSKEESDNFKKLKKIEHPTEEEHNEFARLNKIRNVAKTINFSSLYGSGIKKKATLLNSSLEFAKKLHNVYWDRNKSVKDVCNNQIIKIIFKDGTIHNYKSSYLNSLGNRFNKEIEPFIESMWLLNPINKMWYSLRFLKDIFSALNQGLGCYCFDLYLKEVRKYFKVQYQYHDK